MPDPNTLAQIDAAIERNIDQTIALIAKLVAQPSVAAQNLGITECAQLVASMLTDIGLSAEIMPTAGSPVVYAEGGAGDKTLLFYNHYDVQPPEPLDLWDSPPWELTRTGELMVGRGIGDDKGHLVSRMAALMAIKEVTGGLPCKVKFLVEGEEEVGSNSLPPFIEKYKDKLAADACIWEFGQVEYDGAPLQYLGMRGICYVELSVRTAQVDTHSGMVGSIFHNAAWRLVWALGTLKDQNERILIPDYYENVVPATARDMELMSLLPDESAELVKSYGVKGFLTEQTSGAEFRRRQNFEPTCTICGLDSGYQGEGSKTIVPAFAKAKVDFRLVPNMSPEETLEKLRKHLDAQGFPDVEITYLGGGRPARTDPDHPFIALSNAAARRVYGKDPIVYPMIGGSGPNYPFTHVLNVPITGCGIGNPDGRAHAPNENIRLGDLINGTRHAAHILMGLNEI
jgi:acetylornithine deacetylase/succinyl-diaminopimelate desuccinylase-like protein